MKKCYLDSNILINFKNIQSSFHQETKELLVKLTNAAYKLYISPLTLDEFLCQLEQILLYQKKRNVFTKLSLALKSILDLPRLSLVNPPVNKNKHLKIIKYMKKYALRPRDAYHFLVMKENKISSLATFDQDFKKAVRAGEVEILTGTKSSFKFLE